MQLVNLLYLILLNAWKLNTCVLVTEWAILPFYSLSRDLSVRQCFQDLGKHKLSKKSLPVWRPSLHCPCQKFVLLNSLLDDCMTSRIASLFVWQLLNFPWEAVVKKITSCGCFSGAELWSQFHFLKITKHSNISKLFMRVLVSNSPKLHRKSGIFSAALGPFSQHRCYTEFYKLLQSLV